MPLFTIPKNEWSTPLPAKLDFESSDGEDSVSQFTLSPGILTTIFFKNN